MAITPSHSNSVSVRHPVTEAPTELAVIRIRLNGAGYQMSPAIDHNEWGIYSVKGKYFGYRSILRRCTQPDYHAIPSFPGWALLPAIESYAGEHQAVQAVIREALMGGLIGGAS